MSPLRDLSSCILPALRSLPVGWLARSTHLVLWPVLWIEGCCSARTMGAKGKVHFSHIPLFQDYTPPFPCIELLWFQSPAQDRQKSLGQPQGPAAGRNVCLISSLQAEAEHVCGAVLQSCHLHLSATSPALPHSRGCAAGWQPVTGPSRERDNHLGTNLTSINWLHKWALVVLSSMFLLFRLYSKITSSSLQFREIIITAYAFICTYNYNKLLALIGLWKIYVWPLQKSKHSCSGYYIIITTKENSWNLMI